MTTQSQFEALRKQCAKTLKGNVSKERAARLLHQWKIVANAFNNACELTGQNGRMRPPIDFPELANNKYTPTVMALTAYCHEHDISLKRWCLAQARLIKATRFFTLYQCFGENALSRYADWEDKEQKKALRKEEIERSTTSAYDVIRHSIIANHRDALKWLPVLSGLKPPSKAAGLLYMFPQVSGWYLIAHKEFREDVLDTGFCTEPNLLKLYKRYKNSQNVRQICEETLTQAISQLGPLRW